SELLFGKPAPRILAIERGAGDGGVDAEHRIQRRDVPVGTEGETDMMVQERAEGVGAAGAIVANAGFGPAPLVDSVIRLHGGDHAEIGEAVEIFRGHVLRVLDAEAAVRLAVLL